MSLRTCAQPQEQTNCLTWGQIKSLSKHGKEKAGDAVRVVLKYDFGMFLLFVVFFFSEIDFHYVAQASLRLSLLL